MSQVYIKKLHAKNFRSLADVEIEFSDRLNILVGPNDAGKTNIVEALDLILGDTYLPKFEPVDSDFYLEDTEREIDIAVLLVGSGIQEIFQSSEVWVKFSYSKSLGKAFTVSTSSNEPESDFSVEKPFFDYYKLEKKAFFLRVKSLRNILEITPVRWKSPLKYLKDKIVEHEEEKLEEVADKIREAKEALMSANEVQAIVRDLEQVAREQTGFEGIEFSPGAATMSEILNEMKIIVNDGFKSDISTKGMGSQNSIIIGLFRVYAKYLRDGEGKSVIYGIDEPEIGLHPHGQRQLMKSLRRLTDVSQVVISTHSDHLINVFDINSLIRIGKEGTETKVYKPSLRQEEIKILETHGDSLKEAFFARKLLVVEGDTEAGYFPQTSELMGKSFNAAAISVVGAEGGTSTPIFIKLAIMLNIPYVVQMDEEHLTGDQLNNFVRNLRSKGLLTASDSCDLGTLKRRFNIHVTKPFETAISSQPDETLSRIFEAIRRAYTSMSRPIMSTEDFGNLPSGEKRTKVNTCLKNLKGFRIGRAVAISSVEGDIPEPYRVIIDAINC